MINGRHFWGQRQPPTSVGERRRPNFWREQGLPCTLFLTTSANAVGSPKKAAWLTIARRSAANHLRSRDGHRTRTLSPVQRRRAPDRRARQRHVSLPFLPANRVIGFARENTTSPTPRMNRIMLARQLASFYAEPHLNVQARSLRPPSGAFFCSSASF